MTMTEVLQHHSNPYRLLTLGHRSGLDDPFDPQWSKLYWLGELVADASAHMQPVLPTWSPANSPSKTSCENLALHEARRL
mmetsp:Transcript_14364/g.31772  ORF Transcript_14364/g.31772 Transcript_14364/m.31772 type:complete len:80 (+) Transcript_14364:2-241(+)